MKPLYLQRFRELFFTLTGINAEDATVGEDGWLLVPPKINMAEEHKYDRENIKVLGWREHLVKEKLAGWWVNPWKNVEAKTFIALTLSEDGAKSFSCLRNGKPGQRQIYYIDRVNTGGISGAPMLLGQFIFEFEACPEDALRLTPGGTNRIYYPRDQRISEYGPLTDEEVRDTKNRLRKLARRYPAEVAKLTKRSIETGKKLVGTIEQLVQAL